MERKVKGKETKKDEKTVKNVTSSGQEKVENIVLRAEEKAAQAAVKDGGKGKTARAERTKSGENISVNADTGMANGVSDVKKAQEREARVLEENDKRERVIVALKKEEEKAKKQAKRAEKRAEKAKKQAEAKARREEQLKLRRQKAEEEKKRRLQKAKETRESIEKRRAERAAQAAAVKSETHEARVARLKEERAQKRAAAEKRKEQRRREKNGGTEKGRTPGFGGWLAAVISLGALSLALASVVTVGAMDMRAMGRMATSSCRANLYELVGSVDVVDADLHKARISATPTGQSAVLTDLIVQARLAESNLEKFPVDMESELRWTEFLNRTADEAERMLAKIRSGEELSERDMQTIEYLYAVNHSVREELNGLAGKLSDDTMSAFMKEKADNVIFESFRKIENIATGEGMEKMTPHPQPRGGKDAAPKSDEITLEDAKAACARYFQDYDVVKIEEAGETTVGRLDTLNFFLTDGRDRQYFAQISKTDGALVEFDFYEKCTEKRVDTERAKEIAERYLQNLGYRDMTPVWVNESDLQATFLFAYDKDGTVYYPDTVQVKVCQEKGLVIGWNARAYLLHHRERQSETGLLSIAEAREKLSDKLTVESVSLAVIPARHRGGERTTYEFLCSYEEKLYFVYVDARTGEEVDILGADEIAQGRRLY